MKFYSLIICLNGAIIGGETKMYFKDGSDKSFDETTGGWLLFRNEIYHEGCIIESGQKIIMKINIKCFENHNNNIDLDNYIIIRFLDDNKVYVLHKYMYDKFPNSIFAATKRFENKNEITLQNINYEQFLPVYEYLIGKQYDIIHKDIFEYLGIMNPEIDFINMYNKKIDKDHVQKIIELNNFMNSKKETKLLLIKNYNDYIKYKNIIKDTKNIIPIQFMKTSIGKNPIGNYDTIYMSMYDCVPIYVSNFITDEIITNAENENNELNIGKIRIKMLKMLINEVINEEKDNFDDPDYVDKYNKELDCYINGVCTKELHDFVNNINTKNDYTFLEFIMNTYFWALKTHYEYYDGCCIPTDTYNKKKINENKICNNEFLINKNKFKDAINFLVKNNIIEKIKSLDYDKKISNKDYTSGTFFCNETHFYISVCNIYFGFVNIS